MAYRAADSIRYHNQQKNMIDFLKSRWSYLKFRSTLFLLSLSFYASNFVDKIKYLLGFKNSSGFESQLDKNVMIMLQEKLPGFVIDENTFSG
jgi:hypothetical protein